MGDFKNISFNEIEFDKPDPLISTNDNLQSLEKKGVKKTESKLVVLPDKADFKINSENFLFKGTESKVKNERSDILLRNEPGSTTLATACQSAANLFRLFVKNGEYVYARPNDIIMMESCDHMVKVYVAFNDKIKKTIRHNTLKDFLLQLPADQFMRIGRFCAVNICRLSGGNYYEQTFEFDYKVSIKLKHDISNTAFTTIGK